MTENILCIIPARGGSKRLPRKNILPLAGKPLIAHSIEHALKSRCINKVVVSTDDPEIESVSRQAGAEVIVRPKHLACDMSTSESALLHALDEVEKTGFKPDLIVFLQCTSPIRSADDIDAAIKYFHEQQADSLLSGCENARFLWRKTETAWQSLNYDYQHRKREQDHPEEIQENGSIYVFKPQVLRQQNNRLGGGKIVVYRMDYWSSFQIDSPEDAVLCEWILKSKQMVRKNILPIVPKLVVSDFDGVMTDNKVYLSDQGQETVVCNRGDGWGIDLLKAKGIPIVVLSTEANPVVGRRAEKLAIPCYQAVGDKLAMLRKICEKHQTNLSEVCYVGNDSNDLACLKAVGCAVVVADAHPDVMAVSHVILTAKGGDGAIRELSTMIAHNIK